MKSGFAIGLIGLLIIFNPTTTWAVPDPGVPDTVKIEGGPLVVGQSRPITLTIVNDELLGCFSLGFLLDQIDTGFATFDSAVYVNRMADPSVLDYRLAKYSLHDGSIGISPDTLMIGAIKFAGNALPIGNDAIIELYFTGLNAGTMSIDSTFFPPAGMFTLALPSSQSIYPQFATQAIQVVEDSPAPVLTIETESLRILAGDLASFQVEAQSPCGYPANLEILSLTGYDDESLLPVNPPALIGQNPAEFSWQTTVNDIGIWLATIQACDSAGKCATISTDIQVIGNPRSLISFDLLETPDVSHSSGLVHGDFDNDGISELFTCGIGMLIYPVMALYDYFNGSWGMVYQYAYDGGIGFGPHTGYF